MTQLNDNKLTADLRSQLLLIVDQLGGEVEFLSTSDVNKNTSRKIVIEYNKQRH